MSSCTIVNKRPFNNYFIQDSNLDPFFGSATQLLVQLTFVGFYKSFLSLTLIIFFSTKIKLLNIK